jgi:F-type H+-transporting ATPase subunit b
MRMIFPVHGPPARGRAARAARALGFAACVAVACGAGPLSVSVAAQQHPPGQAVPIEDAEHAARGQEGVHDESVWSVVARVANFVILFGGLGYLLRKPAGAYLDARTDQIRVDLVTAQRTRAEAAAQLEAIQARMQQLPGELEALRRRGREEITAEEARIREMAEVDRTRLLELTRREIDMQLRAARRELTEHAADLAVGLARARFSREANPADHVRLIDQYLAQVRPHA